MSWDNYAREKMLRGMADAEVQPPRCVACGEPVGLNKRHCKCTRDPAWPRLADGTLDRKVVRITYTGSADDEGRRPFTADWHNGSRWRGQCFRAVPEPHLKQWAKDGFRVIEVEGK